MTLPANRLSKSRFVAGRECHKLLWWKVHSSNAVELQPGKVLQDLVDQGHLVGQAARTRLPRRRPDRPAVQRLALLRWLWGSDVVRSAREIDALPEPQMCGEDSLEVQVDGAALGFWAA